MMGIIINHKALAKQGVNVLGSVRPSVHSFIRGSALPSATKKEQQPPLPVQGLCVCNQGVCVDHCAGAVDCFSFFQKLSPGERNIFCFGC